MIDQVLIPLWGLIEAHSFQKYLAFRVVTNAEKATKTALVTRSSSPKVNFFLAVSNFLNNIFIR